MPKSVRRLDPGDLSFQALSTCGYRTMGELGRGGMGVTQIASRVRSDTIELVVIKRPHPEILKDRSARRRFYHEALVATSIDHPCIIKTHTSGEDTQGPFIVLEYIHGITLSELCDRTILRGAALSVPAVVHIAERCLFALEALHESGSEDTASFAVVHRDICPDNIMISACGEVKIGDFGVAKSRLSTVSTDAGYLLGKLPYLPPEYLRQRKASSKLDIYSLGMTLWCALTGRLPFRAGSPAELVGEVLQMRLPPLQSMRADVPSLFCELLGQMCDARPLARPSASQSRSILRVISDTETGSGTATLKDILDHCAGRDLQERWTLFQHWAQALHFSGRRTNSEH